MNNKEFKKVKWGDIYYCNLGHMKGSVQCGRRPVLVIQTNRLNGTSPTVLVAVITSVLKNKEMSTHISLGTEYGLVEESMVMLEQIRTVDKAEELEDYIGTVDDADKINEIKRGLKFETGLPVKPKQKRTGIVLSLCPKCRSEFMAVPENIIKRLDPLQSEKEVCDKCQVHYGYDYIIMKKHNRREQRSEY